VSEALPAATKAITKPVTYAFTKGGIGELFGQP
jgi:hypothetical protein